MGHNSYNQSNKGAIIAAVVIGALIVTGIGFLIYHSVPKHHAGKVVDARWTASTYLRQKTKYHSEEWGEPLGKDIVPGSKECNSKYYGQKECFCHTRQSCSGSGENRHCTSHRSCSSCPEYRTWCVYDYWEWPVVKTLQNAGIDYSPVWQEMTPADGNQRVEKGIVFNVTFNLEEVGAKEYSPTSLDELKMFKAGEYWDVKTNSFGYVKPVKVLSGEKE